MEFELVKRGLLDYAKKRKRWVLLMAALGFSSYGAYKACNFPLIAHRRDKVSSLLGGLVSVAEVISETAETIGVVSKDLKDFLQSKTDEIPVSLTQMSKITRSKEFNDSVVNLTQALTVGISRGYHDPGHKDTDGPCFLDRVLDRLSTPAGSGFVSAIVGSFARNLAVGVYEGVNASDGGSGGDYVAKMVDVICSSKAKALIGDSIQLFVSTAVAVYLDKTMHLNTYDDFFRGMTNPHHEKEVRDLLVSVCSGAMETLVKTSHEVLTKEGKDVQCGLATPEIEFDEEKISKCGKQICDDEEFSVESRTRASNDAMDGGWINKLSNTLAVPSNRSLVLDVTGRVTFETIRTFLEFLVDKLSDAITRCLDLVHELVIEAGFEVARFVTEKASVAATLFLTICLHILDGAWILAPA